MSFAKALADFLIMSEDREPDLSGPREWTENHIVATPERPRIAIIYCTQCGWLLRAAWLAQELLSTFQVDLAEVALVPGRGGVFAITYDGETIWERRADGGFPDAKTLKQRVRDRLDPGRDLGHVDRHARGEGA
jgi:selenoprotein W-related protein